MKITRWTVLVPVGLVLVGAYAASAALGGASAAPEGPTDTGSTALVAPEVEFSTIGGTKASLADYRGTVVVLNIWGTWCPPCVREIPHLVEVQEEVGPRGGTVIGLAVESGTPEDIRRFWADRLELEPAYPLWMGTNREARRHFEAFGLPNTLIIDRDGIIRERFLGLVTRDMLLEAVEPYL